MKYEGKIYAKINGKYIQCVNSFEHYDKIEEISKELLKASQLALKMLKHVKCVQECNGFGTLPDGSQCQWCDEINKIEQITTKAL